MWGMAETGQCGARLRRIAGCKCTGFLLKTAFHRGRDWGSPLHKRLHFKQNDLKGYWKRRKEDIDLYTVKKDARPRLPVYSGWGTWPPHVGLVWDIQSQSSRLFRGRLTNTSRCPVSISLKRKPTCDRSCDLIHLSTNHQDPADPVSHIALDWKCQFSTRPGTLMAKS